MEDRGTKHLITLNKEAEAEQMQNASKIITTSITIVVTASLIGFYGFLVGQYTTDQKTERLVDRLVKESVTVSRFEYEVTLLAQTLVGEAGGHKSEWTDMVSAVFNRIDDDRFPNSLPAVLLAVRPSGVGCEIDAMCDRIMENLTTEIGQEALLFAAQVLSGRQDGSFAVTHLGHSWATPAAAEGHAYFEGLCQVAKASGHLYFGDCAAPTTSLRPVARKDDAVMTAIAMEE